MEIRISSLPSLLLVLALTAYGLKTSMAASHGDDYFPPVTDKTTLDECSACHMAFPAGLLPARSWDRIMSDLGHHFGEDASLSADKTSEIRDYLVGHAADSRYANMRMQRLASSIPYGSTPLRISELPYFHFIHDEVPSYIWSRSEVGSKANCGACHIKADSGSFAEREIHIPKH
jgi:hypothetical protein